MYVYIEREKNIEEANLLQTKYDFDKVLRLDTNKIVSSLKQILDVHNIRKVLVYDDTAVEEIYMFLKNDVTVYLDKGDDIFASVFPELAEKLIPASKLFTKVDLIYLPTNRKFNDISIIKERKRLRKKGLILFKTYNQSLVEKSSASFRQAFPQVMVFTVMSRGEVIKIIFTSKDTLYFYRDKDAEIKPSAISKALKQNSFKKENEFGNGLDQTYDKALHMYSYKLYRKRKKQEITDIVEDETPLMTSEEISSRFTKIMNTNDLKREDFEL
jgi:hypothetical protein